MKFIKSYLLFSLALFYLSYYSFGQNEENAVQMNELNKTINNANNHDTTIAYSYYKLALLLTKVDRDSVLAICKRVVAISENGLNQDPKPAVEKRFLKLKADASIKIGEYYLNEGDAKNSLKYYTIGLEIYEVINDENGLAASLDNIGYVYKVQGDITKALEYYYKSLKICEKLDDDFGRSYLLNNIGRVYEGQGDLEKALEFHNKSLDLRRKLDDKKGIAQSLNNIGLVYYRMGDPKKELEFYKASLAVSIEIDDKKEMANVQSNMAYAYFDAGDFEMAMEFFIKCLKINTEIGYKAGQASNLDAIAKLYLAQDNLEEAEVFANKSYALAVELGYPEKIQRASLQLSQIYEKRKKGEAAFEMYKIHVTMRDSLNNEATQKASAKQQAKYEYEKQKALDDAEYRKILAVEKKEKEKQQIFTMAATGLVLLVGIFLAFVFNRINITSKQKALIELQKVEVEMQHDIIKVNHKEITDSITYAKRIQSAILPSPRMLKEYLADSFIIYNPKEVVAGDFYWLRIQEDITLFAVADCTGHGVPGALVSVVCNNALNRAVREYGLSDPGQILDKTREIVIKEFEKSEDNVSDGMDIALCSLKGKTLHYAGAYIPLWIIRDHKLLQVKADRSPIGISSSIEPYKTHKIELNEKDSIYLFSDGFVDQFGGEKGKKFKSKSLQNLLIRISEKPMAEQQKLISAAFAEWKGKFEQVDDVCIIGIKV